MVKTIINRYLPQGKAIRHVSTLISGTAIGQLAVFLVLPLLTRLYTPDEFGVLAVYASMLGIIATIAGLRYELAIPLPRTDGSAVNILVLAVMCVFIVTTSVLVFIVLFGEQIPIWINMPSIEPYLWFLPLGILLTGLYQAFNYWAIRRHSFKQIARTKIQQGVGGAVAQVVLGFASLGPLGLIVGQIIGQSAGLLELIRGAYRQDIQLMSRVRWQRIKQRARLYKRFPQYTTWSALANSGSTLLPPVLFAALFSPEIAGIYMLAHRALQMPMKLISTAIGQVFHAKAAEAKRKGTLDKLVVKTIGLLLKISVIPLLFIFFVQDLFSLVFGEDWRQAGVFAQWMIPWIVVEFMIAPISVLVSVIGAQFGGMVSQFLFLVVRVGVILYGSFLGAEFVVAVYSISSIILYAGFGVWILKRTGVGTSILWKISVLAICVVSVMSVMAWQLYSNG